jgi:hypothetical protein
MKNSLFLSFLFTTVLIYTACTKTDVAATADSGSFSASINGVAWSSTKIFDNSNKLQKVIAGYDDKSKRNIGINIELASAVTGKVITIGRSNVYEGISTILFAADGLTPMESESAGNGTITITNATSKKIEGTFSAKTSKNTITDGKFSVTLSKFFN